MNGRPLRFLGLATGGWITVRVLLVWQATGSLPEAIRAVVPRLAPLPTAEARAAPARPTVTIAAVQRPVTATPALTTRPAPAAAPTHAPAIGAQEQLAAPGQVVLAMLASAQLGEISYGDGGGRPHPLAGSAPVPLPPPALTGSGWLIARDGVGLGASTGAPQLGGAQGGVRLDYALRRGFAATGRLAAPAAGSGREVSVGIAWRPSRLPIRLVAEQRVAIDGARGGPAIGVSGGGIVPLPGGFALEGYAQAGAIARYGIERYADGIARATRPLLAVGPVTVDAGVGAWGGAQRGVARLDVGPSIGVTAPLAGRPVRLSIDWRQRVAGNARPGSGPALTIGSDF